MNIKKYKCSDDAVVGIVTSFLIVGLIVAVLAVVQTQYVPKWMAERESDHMREVSQQFSQLKYSIDTHISNSRTNTPISTTITLGSKEMPYLMSTRAYGQINVLNDGFNITIKNGTTSLFYKSGVIKYTSFNSYYLNQEYIYESGAIILNQDLGNTIIIKPAFSVDFEKNVTISLKVVNISTVIGNKDDSATGYGQAPIQTEFLSARDIPVIKGVNSIIINSSYAKAWASFINSTLIKSGLNYEGYGTNYTIDVNGNKVTIEFIPDINVNLKDKRNEVPNSEFVEIGAQVDWGVIEQ